MLFGVFYKFISYIYRYNLYIYIFAGSTVESKWVCVPGVIPPPANWWRNWTKYIEEIRLPVKLQEFILIRVYQQWKLFDWNYFYTVSNNSRTFFSNKIICMYVLFQCNVLQYITRDKVLYINIFKEVQYYSTSYIKSTRTYNSSVYVMEVKH